jgi:hypothetical protein
MKLYCKEINRKRTVKEYIFEYLEKCSPATYTESGLLQCNKGKNRSVEDLYYIVKTTYPSIYFKKYINYLYKVLKENKFAMILYCDDIDKVTIYKIKPLSIRYSIFSDCIEGTSTKKNCKYSISDLKKLIKYD